MWKLKPSLKFNFPCVPVKTKGYTHISLVSHYCTSMLSHGVGRGKGEKEKSINLKNLPISLV